MSTSQMFVIGLNKFGNLGINRSYEFNILTPCPEQKISKAFSGNAYSIYTDDNYDKVWSAGFNACGRCGIGINNYELYKLTPITYFNKHGIKIKQISVNTSGGGSFFISADNKLYACGNNYSGQLGLGIGSEEYIYEPILVSD